MCIKDQIEALERELFLLEMKDRWSTDDYILNRQLNEKIKRLVSEEEQNAVS